MRATSLSRVLLAIAAVLITVPGVRMLLDTSGYVASKDNLVLSSDLQSELNALGATFVAVGIALAVGVLVTRFRVTAVFIGLIAFLPQGVLRLLSYATDDGQHESYLRAGVIETIIGVLLVAAIFAGTRRSAPALRP